MSHPMQPQMCCMCCLNPLLIQESRVQTNDAIGTIFSKLIPNFTLEDGSVCIKCVDKLLEFDTFQREISLKHHTAKREGTKSVQNYPQKVNPEKDPEKKIEVKQLTVIKDPKMIPSITAIKPGKKNEVKQLTVIPLMSKNPEKKFEVMPLTVVKETPKKSITVSNLRITGVKGGVKKQPAKLIMQQLQAEVNDHDQPSTSGQYQRSAADLLLLPQQPLALPKTPSFSTLTKTPKVRRSSSSDTLSAEENDLRKVIDEGIIEAGTAQDPKETSEVQLTESKTVVKQLVRCAYCNAVSTQRELIIKHIEEKHTIPCPYNCGKGFLTEMARSKHIKTEHQTVEVAPKDTPGGGKRKKLQTMSTKAKKAPKRKMKGSEASKDESILPD